MTRTLRSCAYEGLEPWYSVLEKCEDTDEDTEGAECVYPIDPVSYIKEAVTAWISFTWRVIQFNKAVQDMVLLLLGILRRSSSSTERFKSSLADLTCQLDWDVYAWFGAGHDKS